MATVAEIKMHCLLRSVLVHCLPRVKHVRPLSALAYLSDLGVISRLPQSNTTSTLHHLFLKFQSTTEFGFFYVFHSIFCCLALLPTANAVCLQIYLSSLDWTPRSTTLATEEGNRKKNIHTCVSLARCIRGGRAFLGRWWFGVRFAHK